MRCAPMNCVLLPLTFALFLLPCSTSTEREPAAYSGSQCAANDPAPCQTNIDVPALLKTLTPANADRVSRALIREAARDSCLPSKMTEVYAAFRLIMATHQVPNFARMANRVAVPLMEKGLFAESSRIFNESYWLRRGMYRLSNATEDYIRNGVTLGKLRHDLEQLQYLHNMKVQLPSGVIAAYQKIITDLHRDFENGADSVQGASQVFDVNHEFFSIILPFFNRAIYAPPALPIPEFILNPTLDFNRIQSDFEASLNGIVVVNNTLTPDALNQLFDLLLKSTIWSDHKGMDLKAAIEDGLHGEILLQISNHLRLKMPRMLGGLNFQRVWSYKINNELKQGGGLGVHADAATMTCNLWVTPSESNLDPESGGLIIYQAHAAADGLAVKQGSSLPFDGWANRVEDDAPKLKLLRAIDYNHVKIPYQANRMLCFRSSLLHKTDEVRFKPGFEHRRIGLTFLFGRPGSSFKPATN